MNYQDIQPVDGKEASLMNPLQLAYIGDAVWDLLIRDLLIRQGYHVHHMHSECIRYVNAHAQAVFVQSISGELTSLERELVRRGRNSHAHHPVPKNQNPEDYAMATGFETLIGFLHLTGNEGRIHELANMILGEKEHG